MAVVLPFENLGPPEHAYFAAGMTDEITNRLSAVSNLGVISRTSAVQYDRSGKTLRQIGEDLGVDYVLEGTVRWAPTPDGGGQVRINPRLIRVTEDLPVWSETYDRQMTDIFTVQTEIASQVIEALGVTLMGGESDRVSEAPTDNLAAYEAYTKAMDFQDPDLETWDRTRVELLETAVRLDPGFVQAWAELVFHHVAQYREVEHTEERLDRARQALEGTEAAGPDHPKTHWARGYYHYYGFREYERALAEFQAAAAALPNDAEARRAIAYILRRQGDFRGCIENLEQAIRLDPKNEEGISNLAGTYEALRRFDEAIAAYGRARELAPRDDDLALGAMMCHIRGFGDFEAAKAILAEGPGQNPMFHTFSKILLALMQDRLDEAETLVLELPEDHPFVRVNKLAMLGFIRAGAGKPGKDEALDRAIAACKELLDRSPGNQVIRELLAGVYSVRGDHPAALREARVAVDLGAKDKAEAPQQQELLAEVYARAGREAEALEILDRLLETDYLEPLTVHMLEHDPRYRVLRGRADFEALLEKHRERIP
jgi:serine/threonine-protein kinase